MKQSIAYGMEKTGMPFIVLNCEGKQMLFLLDTGSSENHLMAYTYVYFKEHFPEVIADKTTETPIVTSGVSGTFESKACSFCFAIESHPYKELFLIMPHQQVFANFSEQLGVPVGGILGSRFLRKYGIIIDYKKKVVYTKGNWWRKLGFRKKQKEKKIER